MKIKICGITDPETAVFAIEKGADFVGIVIDKNSPRYVPWEIGSEIAAVVKEAGAKAVLVCTEAEIDEIEFACMVIQPDLVQLHGLDCPLPEEINRIYVGERNLILRDERDYVLFDNVKPGSGKPFNWDAFRPPHGMPWFLSGGLNPQNVQAAIHKLKPYGVDVSSGVETNGIKDKRLIEEFINQARDL